VRRRIRNDSVHDFVLLFRSVFRAQLIDAHLPFCPVVIVPKFKLRWFVFADELNVGPLLRYFTFVGQLTTVMYEFRNRQDRTMAAQAIPSYAPKQAMAHFNKLECFCFNEYTLQPGETKRWPVVFIVDAKLPKDVSTITLSYTFFEVGGRVPAAPVGGAQSAGVPATEARL
jgi:hypothetical protein